MAPLVRGDSATVASVDIGDGPIRRRFQMMQAVKTILALLILSGSIAACGDNDRHFSSKSDCSNAAPSYNQDCGDQPED